MSVSYRNRTYNRVLGGPRYIHLTKETNAVFPGFFDPLAPAAIIYNSITSVMNYPVLISSDFSDFTSQVTLERYPFSSKGFRHGSTLGGERSILLSYRDTFHMKKHGFLFRSHVLFYHFSSKCTSPWSQIIPRNRLPRSGTPMRSCSLMQTSKTMLFASMVST